MDLQQADKLAEKQLTNGVTDIVLGRMHLAAWSHSACRMTQMTHFTGSSVKPGTVGADILSMADFWPQDQPMLFIGLYFEDDQYTADIYHKDGIAILWRQEEGEHVCNMTVTNFWRFLNTIPNLYQFATPSRNNGRTSEEGKFLLSYFAQHS